MQWLFRIWRPYGDSNPGYRRERGWHHIKNIIVKICNLASIVAKHLSIHVNSQVPNVHNVV